MDAEGPNYRIHVDHAIAWARVWRRPDVDGQTGATFAASLLDDLSRIAADARVVGGAIDLREAPPVAGPATRETLGRMLEVWSTRQRRCAFIAADHATHRLQLAAIVSDFAPEHAVVCNNEEEAENWIRRGESPPVTSRRLGR
jgi:hypothetical protein